MSVYKFVFSDHKSACTELQFLTEHKSPCIYTVPENRICLSIATNMVQNVPLLMIGLIRFFSGILFPGIIVTQIIVNLVYSC